MGSSASDSSGAHKSYQMQQLEDGKGEEARSGDTMGGYARCNVLPFSEPSTAHGHCVLKAVNKKQSKLELRGSIPPAATAMG
jgi:hypothetical protein